MKNRLKPPILIAAVLAATGLLLGACDTGAGNIIPDTAPTFTVTFSANSEDAENVPAPLQRAEGTVIQLANLPEPTRDGYTFVGWNTDRHAAEGLDSFTVGSANVTLYAIWISDILTFTVTFSANSENAENVPAPLRRAEGTVIQLANLPSEPTRDGYAFVGWNPDRHATTGLSSFEVGSADVTLYAIWSPLIIVTFSANNGPGILPEPALKAAAQEMELPLFADSDWYRDGFWYAFRGWDVNSSAVTPAYSPGDMFSSGADVTLYAIWAEYGFAFDQITGTIIPAVLPNANGQNPGISPSGRYRDSGVIIPSAINGVPVTAIGANALRASGLLHTGLRGVVIIPDSVTDIGNHAFNGNFITEVVIPGSVDRIGENAFSSNRLTSVVIEEGVRYIGRAAFFGGANTNRITELALPDSLVTIGQDAFRENLISTVVIPPNITTITQGAFQSNRLISVTLPEGLTTIGNGAFSSPQATGSLTSVNFPSTLVDIGMTAFGGQRLTSIVLPENVAQVRFQAFHNNPLTSITVLGDIRITWDAFSVGSTAVTSSFIGTFNQIFGFNGTGRGIYTLSGNVWTFTPLPD